MSWLTAELPMLGRTQKLMLWLHFAATTAQILGTNKASSTTLQHPTPRNFHFVFLKQEDVVTHPPALLFTVTLHAASLWMFSLTAEQWCVLIVAVSRWRLIVSVLVIMRDTHRLSLSHTHIHTHMQCRPVFVFFAYYRALCSAFWVHL